MSDQLAISYADLSSIENQLYRLSSDLSTLQNNQDIINRNIQAVSNNVSVVSSDLASLAREFHNYIAIQTRRQRLALAETRIVKLRQELDKKYGHYDLVRRTASGILEADDLGLVRKETIAAASENLMLQAPGYWLAPCLTALSAWISNNKELCEKAVREALRRNDEKSSLFWALVSMRAGRREACLRWAERYMAAQDEEALSRNTIIILDAYAAGLLGSDTEGIIYRRISAWMDRLTSKAGFAEAQRKQWANAMLAKKEALPARLYPNLETYSPTWPSLSDVLQSARLYGKLHKHFSGIFQGNSSQGHIKEDLDKILTALVTEFDDEELPIRRDERLEQLIINNGGDEATAQANMNIEKSQFDEKRDFTKLLTEASLSPETSHAGISTQQFATALSKPWIMEAFNDMVAANRAKVPQTIEFSLDAKFATFKSQTKDGRNEEEMISQWKDFLQKNKAKLTEEIYKSTRTSDTAWVMFAVFMLAFLVLLGIHFANPRLMPIGFSLIFLALAAIFFLPSFFSKRTEREDRLKKLEESMTSLGKAGEDIIWAFCAEAVDFRSEFTARDGESSKVIDLLEDVTPEQYVKKLAGSARRIKT